MRDGGSSADAVDVSHLQRVPGGQAGTRRLRIKKIPPDLRRRRPDYALEPVWHKRLVWRLRTDSQFLRSGVQLAFALLCIWIGVEFYFFVQWGSSAAAGAMPRRPPGVEGFLPISALISAKYWVATGIINQIHPAGLAILAAILAVSLFAKKAFCSWLCPIGTVSEALWMLGQKLFGKNLSLPAWLDYLLRALKYLLLTFFLWSIAGMEQEQLAAFIFSPYNKMADVKMYLFFAQLSSFALWTIVTLAFLSVLIKNFWCRFLCPYGALLGIVSWFSPLKITRNKSSCVDCELCTRACPSGINVHTVARVRSDECTSCLACVEACPVRDTLGMKPAGSPRLVPSWVVGLFVAGIFVAVTGLAMLSGYWQNSITPDEYRHRFQNLDSPLYQHFRGKVPAYGPTD